MKEKGKRTGRADHKTLYAAVRQVYADLADLPVQRNCTGIAECCHFKLTGRTPNLTKAEALLAVKAARASGRKELPPSGAGGACPLLKDAKCLIYQDRPFGCRTHFCKAAGGPYTRDSVRALIQRLEALSLQLGAREASNLPTALETAWDEV
jgi:uncharacterized protein